VKLGLVGAECLNRPKALKALPALLERLRFIEKQRGNTGFWPHFEPRMGSELAVGWGLRSGGLRQVDLESNPLVRFRSLESLNFSV